MARRLRTLTASLAAMTALAACRDILGLEPLPAESAGDAGRDASESEAGEPDPGPIDPAWAQWRIPPDVHDVEAAAGINHDLVTGLEWQRTFEDPDDWEGAKKACEAIDLGDGRTFRLPTRIELLSVMSFDRADTGNPFPAQFLDPEWNCYWTISGETDRQTHWLLAAQNAMLVISARNDFNCVARCVASAPYDYDAAHPPAYEIEGDVVRDPKTHLEWQRERVAGKPVDRISLEQAEARCAGLTIGGHDDWRLPTIKELASLVDERELRPALDKRIVGADDVYWSSTEHSPTTEDGGNAKLAWRVNFADGNMAPADDSEGLPAGTALTRCVRKF